MKKTTQNDFVYGLLGRHPLQIDRYCKIMKYWLKIVSGAKPFYVNTVYHASKLRANIDSSYNWASKVKKLLYENEYGDVWENQGVYDPDAFMYVFRQRLIDIYKQNWNARLSESPRARFYRVVIKDLSFYEQLDKIHNKSHRNALARLITSSHRLRVETGRWERPVIPYESRICTMRHKLDDEFHFLLECPRYHDIRRQYLPIYFRVRHSMFKCIELLNTNNDKTVRSLAKYVFEAFRVRSLSVSWYVHVLCVMHWLSPVAGCTRGCLRDIHGCRRWPRVVGAIASLSLSPGGGGGAPLQWSWLVGSAVLTPLLQGTGKKYRILTPLFREHRILTKGSTRKK